MLNFNMVEYKRCRKRFDALDGDGRVSSMGMGQREYGSYSA